jgi:hypothetical protein
VIGPQPIQRRTTAGELLAPRAPAPPEFRYGAAAASPVRPPADRSPSCLAWNSVFGLRKDDVGREDISDRPTITVTNSPRVRRCKPVSSFLLGEDGRRLGRRSWSLADVSANAEHRAVRVVEHGLGVGEL